MYQCDELGTFVHSCVDKFEKLETTSICKTLENFLKMCVPNYETLIRNRYSSVVYRVIDGRAVRLVAQNKNVRSVQPGVLALPHTSVTRELSV